VILLLLGRIASTTARCGLLLQMSRGLSVTAVSPAKRPHRSQCRMACRLTGGAQGLHMGANWRIRLNDPCVSGGDAVCRYTITVAPCYFTPKSVPKYCDECVSSRVCLLVRSHELENHTPKLHRIVHACCLPSWLGPLLAALRYVM